MLRSFQRGFSMLTAVLCAAMVLPANALVLKPKKHAAMVNVAALEEQWRTAQLHDDAAAMDKLLSDDYVGITTTGQVVTKAQQLARIRTRDLAFTSLDVTDTKVKMKGPVVIVTSLAHVVGTSHGQPLDGMFRYTRVYVRSGSGAWKITSFEATRVPNGQARTDAAPNTTPAPEAK